MTKFTTWWLLFTPFARTNNRRRARRKAIVGAKMNLTAAQAKAFWPLYDGYEAKMDKLDDRHAAEARRTAWVESRTTC
jgi:hypothetical protein